MTDTLIARLRPLAEAAKGWGALNKVIAATDETPCQIGQMLDGDFYSLIEIDCENYYGDSLPLANFIVEASPDVVLCLLDRIEALQSRLTALEGQEPVAYEFRMRADWVADWSLWSPCSKEHHEMYIRAPKLHDWVYETRALFIAPGAAPQQAEPKEQT